MPLTQLYPADTVFLSGFNPTAMGSVAAIGQRIIIPCPIRGAVLEVGFCPNSVVTSTATMTVSINDPDVSSTASTYTQVVSSTLGSFASQVLYEGAVASVKVASRPTVAQGGAIQFVTSGNLAAIGAMVYAVIDRT